MGSKCTLTNKPPVCVSDRHRRERYDWNARFTTTGRGDAMAGRPDVAGAMNATGDVVELVEKPGGALDDVLVVALGGDGAPPLPGPGAVPPRASADELLRARCEALRPGA